MYFDQLLGFPILLLLFLYTFIYYCAIFNSLNVDFFNTIRVSNSLDQDQARQFVGPYRGPDLGQTVCKGYQQMRVTLITDKRHFIY